MAEPSSRGLHPIARLLATGGYLGYAPVAPGTVGAFGCAVVVWFLAPEVTLASPPGTIAVTLITVAAFVAMSIWAADVAEKTFGKDASKIVIDEWSGFILSVLFLPKSIFVFVAAFLLFRAIDILKPFPAGRAESVRGGLGIVLDDLVAGVYANILVRLMLHVRGW